VRRIFSPSLYAKVAARTRIYRLHIDSRAARSHRGLDCDECFDHAEAEARGRQRRAARADRRHEIQALVLERLARLDFRADDVAVADEQLELAVRIGNRVAHRDAALEDAHALHVVQIVEYHAPPAADDDDLADLVRIRPADVNVADDA